MCCADTKLRGSVDYIVNRGQLRVSDMLGWGFSGVVCKAEETASGKLCAVKILRQPTLAYHSASLALHYRASSHPNVLAVRSWFEDDDALFLFTDLHPRGDLQRALHGHRLTRNSQSLEPVDLETSDRVLRRLFIQLVDAVEHRHKRGVYHCGIHPRNILLSEDGNVLLTGFGLATNKQFAEPIRTLRHVKYMAPEMVDQGRGFEPYLARHADVWALGIVLCELLSGQCPWQSPVATDPDFKEYLSFWPSVDWMYHINAHGTWIPYSTHHRAPFRHLDSVSDSAITIICRCLKVDPKQRISLPELRQAIAAVPMFYTEGASVPAPVSSLVHTLSTIRAHTSKPKPTSTSDHASSSSRHR